MKTKSKPRPAALVTKPSKKMRTEAEYEELRQMTIALAKCVALTLNTRGKIGVGSGMTMDTKTKEIKRWEEQFFDALDAVGIKYDREAYYAARKRGRR
jgi:hypothetical protein